MTSEESKVLKDHLKAAVAILLNNTPKEELQSFNSIELVVREHLLKEVSNHAELFTHNHINGKILRITIPDLIKASIHTSQMIQERLEEWKNQQVEIFQLPPYSPQLNLIEILWRFMKYEWIELNAYESWDSLVSYVEKVLRDFGSNYVINFA